MQYAQIKDGIVKNVILLDDAGLASHFAIGFDSCIRIDDVSPVPGIGWTYAGSVFSEPTPPAFIVDKANYVGRVILGSNLSAGSPLTLPNDIITNEAVKYTVGLNTLMVYLNGMRLVPGDDFTEIGTSNEASNTIKFLQDLMIGDSIQIQSK